MRAKVGKKIHPEGLVAATHELAEAIRDKRFECYDVSSEVMTLVNGLMENQRKYTNRFRFTKDCLSIFRLPLDDGEVFFSVLDTDTYSLIQMTSLPNGSIEDVRTTHIYVSVHDDGMCKCYCVTDGFTAELLTGNWLACYYVTKLIEDRHVTTQQRVVKDRAKIKGVVVKTKTPYRFVTIDVSKNVIAYETMQRNKEASCGKRAFHHVKSFLRIRMGKIEVVREHFRGNRDIDAPVKIAKVVASK